MEREVRNKNNKMDNKSDNENNNGCYGNRGRENYKRNNDYYDRNKNHNYNNG